MAILLAMRETIRQYLQEALEEVKGYSLPQLSDDVHLPSLGVSSIDFMSSIQIVSDRLGIDIKTEELLGITKVGQLLNVFERKLQK